MRKIVADSSCNRLLLPINYENVKYSRVPLSITVNETNYIDDENLNISKMIEHMESFKGASCTACPGPGVWYEACIDSDEIIMVSITSVLSGSYNSALVAKEMIEEEFPEKKIHVVDTLSAGPMNDLIVEKLAQLMDSDLSFDEIVKEIESYKTKVKLNFILLSIDNFIKNGRVSKIVGLAVNTLNINIVGEAKEGTLNTLHKVRGFKKSLVTLIEDIKQNCLENGKVIISHSFNEEGALKIKDLLLNEFNNLKIKVEECSGLCSYYAERGGILIGYEI